MSYRSYLCSRGFIRKNTGAEVCLINRSIYQSLKKKSWTLSLMSLNEKSLTGIDGPKTSSLGYVILQLSFNIKVVRQSVPFVVVDDTDMPCCAVLGANFLYTNRIVVDFQNLEMRMNIESGNASGCIPLKGIVPKPG